MTTEEKLYDAIKESHKLYMAALEADENLADPYVPTEAFQQKIKKLIHRARHPYGRRVLQCVASICMAFLLVGAALLTFSAEARAEFVGWIKEAYETVFEYRFSDTNAHVSLSNQTLRPTWLPDGFSEYQVFEANDNVMVIYQNTEGYQVTFGYTLDPSSTVIQATVENMVPDHGMVHNNPADIFLSDDPDIGSSIMWTTENNMAFYISAFLDKDGLIKMAESVE